VVVKKMPLGAELQTRAGLAEEKNNRAEFGSICHSVLRYAAGFGTRPVLVCKLALVLTLFFLIVVIVDFLIMFNYLFYSKKLKYII
jgi:hypothetical protein